MAIILKNSTMCVVHDATVYFILAIKFPYEKKRRNVFLERTSYFLTLYTDYSINFISYIEVIFYSVFCQNNIQTTFQTTIYLRRQIF